MAASTSCSERPRRCSTVALILALMTVVATMMGLVWLATVLEVVVVVDDADQVNSNLKHSREQEKSRFRVLYIVTSMHELDTGRRETKRGYDRFSNTILPCIRIATQSLVEAGMHVDVYFVAQYNVTASRREQLLDALPPTSGLQVWSEATPFGYAKEHSTEVVQDITRALARQHRFIIKDKFPYYDMFCAFEDDMLITAPQVQHFAKLSQHLEQLLAQSQRQPPQKNKLSVREMEKTYYGDMTRQQLSRLLPGFVRVEVVLDEKIRDTLLQRDELHVVSASTKWEDLIKVDLEWEKEPHDPRHDHVTAEHCCSPYYNATTVVTPDDLYYWETSLDVLGVRTLPAMDNKDAYSWAVPLAGSQHDFFFPDPSYVVGDYWSGRIFNTTVLSPPAGSSGNNNEPIVVTRPDRTKGRYMNNQGGWMGLRRQVLRWHKEMCPGGFLPPFEGNRGRVAAGSNYLSLIQRGKVIEYDGLGLQSVEFWSGGLQLAGQGGCHLQRIVLLQPDDFSKHLLFHTSNNKQRQPNVQHRFSKHSIEHLYGQLNTVRKHAERAIKLEQQRERAE